VPTRRRLTLLLLLLPAIVAAGLVGAGCSDQQVAVKVGDTTVSQSDFEAELDAFAELQGRDGVTGELASSYTQEFVAAVLGQRIELMLAGQVFDERGLELTDDQISGVTAQAGDQLDGFPRDLRSSLIEDVARRSGLLDELGQQDYNRALTEAADSTDIEVSSHYGSWDPEEYRVVPPDGPAGAEPSQVSGGDTTGGG
jgi:SurA-like N-terminal domain